MTWTSVLVKGSCSSGQAYNWSYFLCADFRYNIIICWMCWHYLICYTVHVCINIRCKPRFPVHGVSILLYKNVLAGSRVTHDLSVNSCIYTNVDICITIASLFLAYIASGITAMQPRHMIQSSTRWFQIVWYQVMERTLCVLVTIQPHQMCCKLGC